MDQGLKLDRGFFGAAIAGLIAGAAYWLSSAPFWPSLVIFTNLYVLALYDWHYFRLPNVFTAMFALLGLLYLLATPDINMAHHIIGGFIGLVFFPLLNLAYRGLRGRDGIGMGDAKFLAGIGLWLGWQSLPYVLLVASLAGLLFAGICWARNIKITNKTKLPFGTFLGFSAWLIWLFPYQG